MSKFEIAYKNEMIKIFAKRSILIILIAMIITVVCMSYFVTIYPEDNGVNDIATEIRIYAENQKEYIQQEENKIEAKRYDMENWNTYFDEQKVDFYTALYKINLHSHYLAASDIIKANGYPLGYFVSSMILEKAELESNIYMYENYIKKYDLFDFIRENGIPYSQNIMIDKALNAEEAIEKINEYITNIDKIIEEKDFYTYINNEKKKISVSDYYTDIQRKVAFEKLDFMLKEQFDGKNQNEMALRPIIEELFDCKEKLELSNSVSKIYNVLTDDETKYYERTIKELEYKIHTKYYLKMQKYRQSSLSFAENSVFISMLFVTMLIIILGGSCVSEEISKGTVKFLLVSPVKRKKVFWGKCLSVFTVGVLSAIVITITILITAGVLYGFDTLLPYVYTVNGIVHELSYALYVMCYTLASFISIIFYASFAVMISALAKNTVVAVGTSIGVYYIIPTVIMLFKFVIDSHWLKYIPMMCAESIREILFVRAETEDVFADIFMRNVSYIKVEPWFALIYVTVVIIAMLWTARDSFCKSDIN